MNRPLALAAAVAAQALSGCASAPRAPALPPPVTSERDTIRAFSGEAELAQLLRDLQLEGRREYEKAHADDPPPGPVIDYFYYPPIEPPKAPDVPVQIAAAPAPSGGGSIEPSTPPPVSPPTPAPAPAAPLQIGDRALASRPVADAAAPGVDEGGMVKAVGDYLVVLHRGRLFTVRVGGGALQPVAATDAFGPGVQGSSYTYDRMLVSGDRVLVLGIPAGGGGSLVQVGVFRLAPDGRLAHQATYYLRSLDDYSRYNYGSRTDAVRLVGDRLVFYVPLPVETGDDPLARFPAVSGPGVVAPPAAAVRVYRPAGRVNTQNLHLHALTTCDLAADAPRCQSTALLAGGDRPFHVTGTAVYLWASQPASWEENAPQRSVLYRIPLDGSTPTALRVAGKPVDESSFLESGGYLHVLLSMDARPGAQYRTPWLALLRVPVSALGAGRDSAAAADYRELTTLWSGVYHRFVGDWLVYAIPDSPVGGSSTVHAVRLEGGGDSQVAVLPYRADRVEAMGADAAVLGSHEHDLHLDVVRLGSEAATLADSRNLGTRIPRPGFDYREDGEGAGVLGLPFYGPDRPGYEHLELGSASILFLRSQDHRLGEMGELASGEPTGNDGCQASCRLWYGNARTLFLRGRVLTLLGYELVEGREEDGRIRELRRVGFAPTVPPASSPGP
jgi:hypothetical protein